ncbi:MAG TPA: glycosyltransferase [Thermoanaerobaculia bacterium]|nr:glycosyltransferase [Thermoanaerobaculia bacterium]
MSGARVSVVIASDRVADLLPVCLESLVRQRGAADFEVLVASSSPPAPMEADSISPIWIEASDRNPARRRNLAARHASGEILAFLDDDAEAEPGWLAAGAAALERCDIAGGPDVLREGAPLAERLSDLLLATPGIGSGVPAHERRPRAGAVRSPHDLALCNLFARRRTFDTVNGFDEALGYVSEDTDFIRRAMEAGARVELDPAIRVRHRRRSFPRAYLAQRWRYRLKTGRLLVERPGLHARGRIAVFLGAGFLLTSSAAFFGPAVIAPALAAYAAATWILSFPIWRRDPVLFPFVPFAFALHHATYFAALLAGMAAGTAGLLRAPRSGPAPTRSRS